MLDNALDVITSAKTDSNSFFWSDMLPSKAAYITNTYSFANALDVSIYPLSKIYNFATANYNGVLVYITNSLGIITQLINGVDYTISSNSPSLTVTLDLAPGDQITVKEYNQTYGSYVPNTPTKLGLYPSTIPTVILDTAYYQPTYFIVGHDGSYNKLYGDYIDGVLIDFRFPIGISNGKYIPISQIIMPQIHTYRLLKVNIETLGDINYNTGVSQGTTTTTTTTIPTTTTTTTTIPTTTVIHDTVVFYKQNSLVFPWTWWNSTNLTVQSNPNSSNLEIITNNTTNRFYNRSGRNRTGS
jgi:hypothetical protein